MDQAAFYKDQYDKSLAAKSDINSSLSTPIGILTALLAGLYFCATNFNYDDATWLSNLFIVIAAVAALLLVVAIFYLGRVFADFISGRNYLSLNDPDVLNQYYISLLAYYTTHPPALPLTPQTEAQKDFEAYFLAELIRNASNNQQINRVKTALLFQSNRFMIYALISISLLIIPFGIDFGRNRKKDKIEKVKIEQALPLDLTIKYQNDTTARLYLKPITNGKANSKH